MKKFFSFLIITFVLLVCASCGKKGPIYPPVPKAPKEAENFQAIQRGDKILMGWENPVVYKDGAPLESIGEVEIWLAKEEIPSKKEEEEEEEGKEEGEGRPFQEEYISGKNFEEKAEIIKVIKGTELSSYIGVIKKDTIVYWYFYEIEDKDFLSKKYVFALKVNDRKKRQSNFSRIISVKPRVLPLPPQNLRQSVHPDHIELIWDPPEKNIDESSPPNVLGYNVYRQRPEEYPILLNPGLIKGNEFRDRDFLFDVTYRYFVRASTTDSIPYFESYDSEIVEVLPKDTFPPRAPEGMIVMSGANSISLSWDANTEEDLGGYRVWRKTEGEEEYTLLTLEAIRENTFTDTDVEKNKRYHYVITALDKNGNESANSDPISEIIKDNSDENLPF